MTMILLDSAAVPTGGGAAISFPEQYQNAPLKWTLQYANRKQEAGITPLTALDH